MPYGKSSDLVYFLIINLHQSFSYSSSTWPWNSPKARRWKLGWIRKVPARLPIWTSLWLRRNRREDHSCNRKRTQGQSGGQRDYRNNKKDPQGLSVVGFFFEFQLLVTEWRLDSILVPTTVKYEAGQKHYGSSWASFLKLILGWGIRIWSQIWPTDNSSTATSGLKALNQHFWLFSQFFYFLGVLET
jgi:hypothetical protein